MSDYPKSKEVTKILTIHSHSQKLDPATAGDDRSLQSFKRKRDLMVNLPKSKEVSFTTQKLTRCPKIENSQQVLANRCKVFEELNFEVAPVSVFRAE